MALVNFIYCLYIPYVSHVYQGRLIELLDDILEGDSIPDSSLRDLLRISAKLSVLDVALKYSKKN